MKAVFIPMYFPPVSYFRAVVCCHQVRWDVSMYYEKQTYRNRMNILSANGVQSLSVPIQRQRQEKKFMQEVCIFHAEPWRKKHWRSLESAYRSSPYFEYYEDSLRSFFEKRYEYLLDYQKATFAWCCKALDLPFDWSFEQVYREDVLEGFVDMRHLFHPKKTFNIPKEYTQVFSDKFGFTSDLSILDLLFCEGKRAKDYLLR